MRDKLLLTFLVLFCFEALCQETVFIKAVENGNGFTRERAGECFIITPNHVVLENFDVVKIVAKNRLELKGELIESFEPDLAILKLEKSTNLNCKSSKKTKNLNEVLENAATGFLEYRDEFGASNLLHVNITSIDQESIAVIPQDPSQQFIKGMSGASFYVNYKTEKVLLGMLLNIEEDLKTGYIYQIDDIERMLSPFFNVQHDQPKNLGILILKEGIDFIEVTNRLITHLSRGTKYQAVKKLPNTEFLHKEFNAIIEGRFNKNVPQKLKENLNEIFLGEVLITKFQNSKNLYKIDARLEGNLFSSADFKLIKNVHVSGKGLNSDENIAYDQSIKALLNNIEIQLE